MNGTLSTDRNTGMDVLKCLCSFLVVCAHVGFSTREYIEPLTRTVVPVFFMISGYFCSSDSSRQLKQIRRILKLLFIGSVLYAAWELLRCCFDGTSVSALFSSWFGGKNILRILLLNLVPFKGHLWYLSALVYVLILSWLAGTHRMGNLYWLIPLLLVFHAVLGPYSPFLFRKSLYLLYTRNFLFMGLPFFLLGKLISQKESFVKKLPALPMLTCSVLLLYFEFNWLAARLGPGNRDFYIFGAFSAVSYIVFAIKHSRFFDGPIAKTLASWGRRHSLWIYILHPLFIELLPALLERIFGYDRVLVNVYYGIAPLLIFFLSMAVSCLIEKGKASLAPAASKP